MSEKRLQIIHLGISGFPHNVTLAPIQKSYLIYKGLVEAGAEVLYINVLPQASSNDERDSSTTQGISDGIRYIYTGGTPYRSASFVRRNWTKLRGMFGEAALLWSLARRRKIDVAILYTAHLSVLLYYRAWSKLFGFPLVMNYVEYRSAIETSSFQRRISWRLTDRFAPQLVDAMLPISEFLIEKIKQRNPNLAYLKVPTLCDFARYDLLEHTGSPPRYFLYCGSAAYFEVANFITASFEQVNASDVYLYLIINGWPLQKEKVYHRINQSQKRDLIKTFSNVSNEDYARLLSDAEGLLIPLRPTVQDMARFPNKVGEYVASGNPMVTTEVGEIAYYFEDQVSAFLATEYHKGQFAQKMQQVVDNPTLARAVGRRGQQVGEKHFDYRANGVEMMSFLNQLSKLNRKSAY
jgi:glycosyltransferase involved in cell wall biosynthesis